MFFIHNHKAEIPKRQEKGRACAHDKADPAFARPGSRIDQEVQEAGGYMNAYTSFDRTVYHIDVPNTGARVAIDILCDIMQNAALPPEELAGFLRELPRFETLKVQGLMTLALFTSEADRVRECFRTLRTLRDRARADSPELIGPGELSMGMSGDYELAIEEGATCVRVGQAIFGARNTPDSQYWPPTRPQN